MGRPGSGETLSFRFGLSKEGGTRPGTLARGGLAVHALGTGGVVCLMASLHLRDGLRARLLLLVGPTGMSVSESVSSRSLCLLSTTWCLAVTGRKMELAMSSKGAQVDGSDLAGRVGNFTHGSDSKVESGTELILRGILETTKDFPVATKAV